MPRPSRADRQNEVAFCAEVSKWSDSIFKANSALTFAHSKIEQYATGSNKRADLRFYDQNKALILCGEVKLPGADKGESPYNPILMADAYNKATMDNCRYFFTWNVEELALFDRSVWDAPTMNERYVHSWKLGLKLNHPSDVISPTVVRKLQDEFLPKVFGDIDAILAGRQKEFSRPPADIFLTVLESYLLGPNAPVRELQYYLEDESARNSEFKKRFIDWMVKEQEWNINPDDFKTWQKDVERAAESMCYILNNRILFYQAIVRRNRLPELMFPDTVKTADSALKHLNDCFHLAEQKTGDYESIFRPERESADWTTVAALSGDNSIQAWNNVIHWVEKLNFKELPSDILGKTFQKLISPEERHRFGQHYTDETIVDVINAFCIRKGTETVLDPSCGSGGFLVRAYYRKQQLDKSQNHQRLLSDIYGCDINAYPAHLATLNLAARKIENEENYPRIAHKNFFKVKAETTFCELPVMDAPGEGHRGTKRIKLPEIDAVVGNPPYVRQEKIPKKSDRRVVADQTKEYIGKVAESAYPGSQLTKQSDLHVYFWLASARFLSQKGMFGFLTSSSWLDAKYGFALQRWILTHFKLIAIIESLDEPWFSDARIKTCATIMERCDDAAQRAENVVRFVRLKRPLAEILGKSRWEAIEEFDGQEHLRQEAAEKLRDLILKRSADYSGDDLRILTKRQSELWDDGLCVAEMFERQKQLSKQSLEDDDESSSDETEVVISPPRQLLCHKRLTGLWRWQMGTIFTRP